MIFGIPALFFWLIMLLAFLFGAAGTLITMAIVRFAAQRKAKEKKNNISMSNRCEWNRMTRDEQLYSGR